MTSPRVFCTALAVLFVSSILTSGCAANPQDPSQAGNPSSAETAPTGTGLDKRYAFTAVGGATGTFSIPSVVPKGQNDLVDRIEKLRKKYKQADQLTYVVVDVDNRDGADNVNMYMLTVVDQNGNQYESIDESEMFGEWVGDGSTTAETAELSNDLQFYLVPGAKGVAVKVFDQDVPSVSRVFVEAAGSDEPVEAVVA